MSARWILYSVAIILGATAAAPSASALTAGEFLDKLDSAYQAGFLIGSVDMASHMFAVQGNKVKAQCVLDWFFRGDREKAQREVNAFFDAHKDGDAVAVLHVLINRKCGA